MLSPAASSIVTREIMLYDVEERKYTMIALLFTIVLHSDVTEGNNNLSAGLHYFVPFKAISSQDCTTLYHLKQSHRKMVLLCTI